jgi:uncharacterized membrane protein YoaK (UPF0700 family)
MSLCRRDVISGADPARHPVLLMGLTLVAALVDSIAYLGLHRVFPADMTGRTVLLGLGLGGGDLPATARSATALGGFLAGGATAAALVRSPRPSRTGAALLGTEVAAISAICLWWVTLGRPAGAALYGLIAPAAMCMGAQSAPVARLSVPGVATTYTPGTWTTLCVAAADRLRRRGPF